jgi:hypothetical protein
MDCLIDGQIRVGLTAVIVVAELHSLHIADFHHLPVLVYMFLTRHECHHTLFLIGYALYKALNGLLPVFIKHLQFPEIIEQHPIGSLTLNCYKLDIILPTKFINHKKFILPMHSTYHNLVLLQLREILDLGKIKIHRINPNVTVKVLQFVQAGVDTVLTDLLLREIELTGEVLPSGELYVLN